ncbi:hypothetical protein HZI73_22485 [Vallitalea pronyensis]|uniref:Uncharacterized protein n=1 Tax=Vallitalea pronyensis TaxID=1348613 RepID=A0A8J8SIV2_9FIRM|nr:hypothetical protein [Vallitalea pronyensis]QUI24898.1 hypothetical protein HZI73_22485 [Vallitalea pronyensis]
MIGYHRETWGIQVKKKDLAIWKTIASTSNMALRDEYYKIACKNYKHVRIIELDDRGKQIRRLKGVK